MIGSLSLFPFSACAVFGPQALTTISPPFIIPVAGCSHAESVADVSFVTSSTAPFVTLNCPLFCTNTFFTLAVPPSIVIDPTGSPSATSSLSFSFSGNAFPAYSQFPDVVLFFSVMAALFAQAPVVIVVLSVEIVLPLSALKYPMGAVILPPFTMSVLPFSAHTSFAVPLSLKLTLFAVNFAPSVSQIPLTSLPVMDRLPSVAVSTNVLSTFTILIGSYCSTVVPLTTTSSAVLSAHDETTPVIPKTSEKAAICANIFLLFICIPLFCETRSPHHEESKTTII